MMTHRQWIFAATAASAALLAGAFVFQALGYAPCKLCFWQRYPHGAAVVVGILALLVPRLSRGLVWIGAVSALTTAVVGFYHSGVEQKWWPGPSSCSGGGSGLSGLDGASLLSTDIIDKVVMCDEISWTFAGLSMPTWNGILSLAIVGLWICAIRAR